MALDVGTHAPEFSLAPAPGPDRVSLSDYRGKPVVVLFFPLAYSPVCHEEMCAMAEDLASWNDLGAQVLGISVDSPFVNQKFAADTGAEFPILSDFNREAATAYGVRNDDFFGMKGVANRSAFVVDAEGVIRYAWTSENPGVMPQFDEIKEAVRALG